MPWGPPVTGWLGVEARHLAALVAVEREGSFRGAATRLGLVQSAISQRIAQLEQLVGLDLVERSRGPATLRLTDAGRTLVGHSDEILAQFDAARADLRAVTTEPAPPLRVGTYELASTRLVAPALQRLAMTAPDVDVDLHEDNAWERFFPLVASGALDAAFADLPLHPGPFRHRELTRDPCVLVVHKNSPLARRQEPPTLPEIGALPLISPSSPMRKLISDQLRAAGVEPYFVASTESGSGAQAHVAQGIGAALMPRLAVNDNDPTIAVVSLAGVLPPRRIAVYWHRDRRASTAIADFVAALETVSGSGLDGDRTSPHESDLLLAAAG